jgi:hypothetical protein
MILKFEKGAATLSVVLLLAGVMMELTIAGVIISMLISNTVFSSRLSSEALAVARGGAQDAVLKIVRDKDFISTEYFIPTGCALNGLTPCSRIVVEKDISSTCSQSISAGQDCIISTGTSFTRNKKIEAIVGVDSFSGKVNVLSLEEKPI